MRSIRARPPGAWMEGRISASTIDFVFLIGRILYGGFFLMGGFNHFTSLGTYKQYTASMGVPAPGLAIR